MAGSEERMCWTRRVMEVIKCKRRVLIPDVIQACGMGRDCRTYDCAFLLPLALPPDLPPPVILMKLSGLGKEVESWRSKPIDATRAEL
jgi:hypothetical protein